MRKELTENEKKFIRDNYLKLTEPQIANILHVGRFAIQKFKREEGLAKYPHNRDKKVSKVEDKMIFNVDTRMDWVA